MVSASRQSPGSHARSDVPRVAIHSLSHIHALRKLNPRFAQAIHGLSAQSAIHGLRKTIHGWSRSTVCAEHIYMCVCVCVCRQKTRLFAVLPLENRHEIALYRSASQFIFFERCLESRTSLLSSAMAMGF